MDFVSRFFFREPEGFTQERALQVWISCALDNPNLKEFVKKRMNHRGWTIKTLKIGNSDYAFRTLSKTQPTDHPLHYVVLETDIHWNAEAVATLERVQTSVFLYSCRKLWTHISQFQKQIDFVV